MSSQTDPSTRPARTPRSPLRSRLRILRRSPLVVAAALWLVTLVLIGVALAPFVTDAANRQDLALRFLEPWSLEHGLAFVLGADSLGRPILLQLVVGAQTSLVVAAGTVLISAALGFVIGLTSGYVGGWVDQVLARIADILQTVPSLLLALVVLYVLEPSVLNLIAVLAITRIPLYLRTARSQALELRERVFVESSRSVGASTPQILTRDLAPMVFPTMRTLAMLEVGTVILAAASLSFLGIGLQRPDVDWGMMVADGRAYLASAWWVTVMPGVFVVLTALAANIVSNWMRAVEDPRQSAMFLRRRTRRRRSVTS